jgi:hypothetical protein
MEVFRSQRTEEGRQFRLLQRTGSDMKEWQCMYLYMRMKNIVRQ